MPCCVVPLCKNTNSNSKLSFCRFPVDEIKRKQWISRLRRKNYTYKYHDRICSWHFPNGREEGAIRFDWNKDKSFLSTYPDSSKSTRPKTQKILPPKPKSIPVPFPEQITNGKKRKQIFETFTYSSPVTQNGTVASSSISINLQLEVERLRKENSQLHVKIHTIEKEANELRVSLNKVNKDLTQVRGEQKTLRDKLKEHQELKDDFLATTIQVRVLERENVKLNKKINSMKK